MKNINNYINEAIKSEDQVIINFLNKIAQFSSGYQQKMKLKK